MAEVLSPVILRYWPIMATPFLRPGELVLADPDLHKPERVNVSLSRSLLKRIDAQASNRSRFLAEAAEAKLAGE